MKKLFLFVAVMVFLLALCFVLSTALFFDELKEGVAKGGFLSAFEELLAKHWIITTIIFLLNGWLWIRLGWELFFPVSWYLRSHYSSEKEAKDALQEVKEILAKKGKIVDAEVVCVPSVTKDESYEQEIVLGHSVANWGTETIHKTTVVSEGYCYIKVNKAC